MEGLIKRLEAGLTADPDVTAVKSGVWELPVTLYDVAFSQVKRLKMDILLKMLLFAFQEADIRRAAVLADMLAVEELFVREGIDKMRRSGLILLGKKGYVLTSKGFDYLEKGIFEEELDDGQAQIYHSADRGEYLLLETEEVPAADSEFPPYRYALEESPDPERLYELLSREKDSTEENFQLIVSGIKEIEKNDVIFIPCVEFQLYDRKQDIFYSRVWNTQTEAWDAALEKAIETRELLEWRKAMDEKLLENKQEQNNK